MRLTRRAAIGVLALWIAGAAHAHTRSESYSHWYLSETTPQKTIDRVGMAVRSPSMSPMCWLLRLWEL